jgi:hypothetical protein
MRGWLTALFFLAAIGSASAQDVGADFFERKIRPILVEHCYECHSAKAKRVRASLLLDTRDGLRKGGETGPAVEPGRPDRSLLIHAVRFTDDNLKMPPKGKLPATAIADLEEWIRIGAPDPRGAAVVAKSSDSWDEIVKARRDWWSLRPVARPVAPQPKNASSKNPVDRFWLTKLEENDIPPAAAADPKTLIRRLSLVLTGLPPTPEDVDTFVRACGPLTTGQPLPNAAVEKLVDSLLASPHFGERWARHWMDVVRFTETHGNEWNYEVHHAWRYRDYLIRAFNEDVPFDQFVREHVAGDLLSEPRHNRKERFNESVIGTAFYRFGEVNHDDCISLPQIGYDLVDNQIDTLTKAFQATTVACARCHDHKLDAVSMRDYHGVLGILRSSRQVSHTIDDPDVNAELRQKLGVLKRALRRVLADAWLRRLGTLEGDLLARPLGKEPPMDDALAPWEALSRELEKSSAFADAWKKVIDRFAVESNARTKFNRDQFTVLADFRQGSWPDWQVGGQGFGEAPSRPGDFSVVGFERGLLPAGAYTHALSPRLNGTLRSPVLSTNKKWISFHVLGEQTSAVRLVSNNCQLNYKNYRALVVPQPRWISFPIPEDPTGLRVYAELMTKFDNPKFPDQLGKLGGDNRDDRIPWEKAASDPTSYFGVTQVVLHDKPGEPKAEFSTTILDQAPASRNELATRHVRRLEAALSAWSDDKANDDDVRWINAFLTRGLLDAPAKTDSKVASLIGYYREIEKGLSLPRIVPGMADCGPGIDQPVFVRGDCTRPGETTPRRYVEVLAPTPIKSSGSGRRELAEILASRDNPLTARVFVNRVWHHLFGAGFVRTVDDFGHVGDRPSHPELLDHLAAEFMDDGWSVKRLIRRIVLSRPFRTTHEPSSAAVRIDPENRLLHHYPARRMEAEAIRDSILAASGRLDRTLYGMSIPSHREKANEYRRLFPGPPDGNGRRSIYIKVTLMEAPKFLDAFDFPGGKVTQGRRDVTSVPAQALALLNDPFVRQQADVWAKQIVARAERGIEDRVNGMFRTALGREPTTVERDRFIGFVRELVPGNDETHVWSDVAHTFFNLQEFVTIP